MPWVRAWGTLAKKHEFEVGWATSTSCTCGAASQTAGIAFTPSIAVHCRPAAPGSKSGSASPTNVEPGSKPQRIAGSPSMTTEYLSVENDHGGSRASPIFQNPRFFMNAVGLN